MKTMSRVLLSASVAACMTTAAHAGLLVSIVDSTTGLHETVIDVAQGPRDFSLRVLGIGVNDGTGQIFDMADFDVVFSRGGLIFNGYDWVWPDVTSTDYDSTIPANEDAPLVLTMDGIAFAAMENPYVIDEYVGDLIVTLDLTVPPDWMPAQETVKITVVPDPLLPFASWTNFEFPTATVGDPFTLRIIPEPATLVLLGIGGIAALRRRRSA